MENLKLHYGPAFEPVLVREELLRLLAPGVLSDADLERRIERLEERFAVYTSTYQYGAWEPWLHITNEMRALTEFYLPLTEIRGAFNRFFSLALTFSPFLAASPIHTTSNWLDVLEELYPLVRRANPGNLLRRLITDEELRIRFIFAIFLPRRYGGEFGRYGIQAGFLKRWLVERRSRFAGQVSCLDAACGSGEGTYELAMLLVQSGFAADSFQVHGSSVEPLELFAAAHGYFPHNPSRESAYHKRIQPLIAGGAVKRVSFFREDITAPASGAERRYDVILCNGLLGGPMLHAEEELKKAVGGLAERLEPGGILLAADRFHSGWKKVVPEDLLQGIIERAGLSLLPVEEGVGGIKHGVET